MIIACDGISNKDEKANKLKNVIVDGICGDNNDSKEGIGQIFEDKPRSLITSSSTADLENYYEDVRQIIAYNNSFVGFADDYVSYVQRIVVYFEPSENAIARFKDICRKTDIV